MADVKMTVTQLDELAALNDVADYPTSGNKAEKVAALEAAGIALEVVESYGLRLRPAFFDTKHPASESADSPAPDMVASFQAGWEAVTLEGDEVWTTTDRQLFEGLKGLPFLEAVEG